MNRDFKVGTDAHALREAKAIKRLEYALVAFAREIWLAVVEGSAKHVSPASERMNPCQAEPIDIFNGCSLVVPKANLPNGVQPLDNS